MVSIVIPTYNRPHMLKKLLKSIAAQTFKAYEIIIIDDHSTKANKYTQVIEEYKTIFKDLTFLRNRTNKGAPNSRNKGIKNAKYNLIAFVDDDDTWLPNKLQKQVDIFQNTDQKVGLIYTWADAVDETGKTVYEYRSDIEGGKSAYNKILEQDFIPSPTVMVRKQAIVEAGLFDETFPSCQDWDMWARILLNGNECRVVKSVEAIYKKHSEETIGKSPRAMLGYARFYRKHLKKALNCNVILGMKYIYRYLKISL